MNYAELDDVIHHLKYNVKTKLAVSSINLSAVIFSIGILVLYIPNSFDIIIEIIEAISGIICMC